MGGLKPSIKVGGSAVAGVVVLIIVSLVVLAISWMNSKPEVIRAKAELVQANAALMNARAPIIEGMPQAFTSAVPLVAAVAIGFTLMVFFGAMSLYTLLHKADNILSHGIVVQRNVNGQVQSWKLEQTHPAPQLPKGGNIHVEKPQQAYLPRDEGQRGSARSQGRKLQPGEVTAPGRQKNQMPFPSTDELIQAQLGMGERVDAPAGDPLDDLRV